MSLKIKDVHELFDKRTIEYVELRQDIIEIDFNLEFSEDDERRKMLRPRARVKVLMPKCKVRGSVLLFDDGYITRKVTLTEEEKEYIKKYACDQVGNVIDECKR